MTTTSTATEHAFSSVCFCDDCERIGFDLAREAREEEANERAERLALRNAHPLIWR